MGIGQRPLSRILSMDPRKPPVRIGSVLLAQTHEIVEFAQQAGNSAQGACLKVFLY